MTAIFVGMKVKVYRNSCPIPATILAISEDKKTLLLTPTSRSKNRKNNWDEFIYRDKGVYFKKGSAITTLIIKGDEK